MPTGRVAAVDPLQTALADLLLGDAPLTATLASAGSIFSIGTVPKDAPLPLIQLGDVGETSWLMFGKAGNRTQQTITIIAPRTGGVPGVAKIYAHLVRLLEGGTLVVVGHAVAMQRVELVSIFNDPNGTDVRGVVRFTVDSQNA